jgi:hypothetical protein
MAFIVVVAMPVTSKGQIVTKGTVRLSLDTVFLDYASGSKTDVEVENENGLPLAPIIKNSLERNVDYDAFTIGFGSPSAGISLGGAIIDNLVLGARLTLGYKTESQETGASDETIDGSVFDWGVLPYLEYVFPTGLVRPFLIAMVGFGGQLGQLDDIDYTRWGFYFGGGGGAHLFFNPHFSLDAFLLASYGIGRGEEQGRLVSKYDFGLFEFNIIIGISGWI